MTNKQVEKRIEPAMHLFAIGFPFVTAIVGLIMDVYAEPEVCIKHYVRAIVAVGLWNRSLTDCLFVSFIRSALDAGSTDGPNFVGKAQMALGKSAFHHW